MEFASTLYQLGKNADRLFEMEARLKETRRATHLLHDLRPFSSELLRISKTDSESGELWLLASQFDELIEGYLKSIRTGVTPEAPGLVSLASLLSVVGSITEKKIGKKFSILGDINTFLWISEPLLQRVLLNLIRNGLEAGHGETPVTVSAKRVNGGMTISILDNGGGIPESILASLGDSSRYSVESTKNDGNGLGLQSAFECADTIGADIRLVDTGLNGTCFEIYLPLGKTTSPACETDCEILVIDDSQAVLDAWNEYGHIAGQKIQAVTPEEAVNILNNPPTTLSWVVLDYDLKLPNGNGATLSKFVRKLGAKLALSSGYRVDELPQDARDVEWDTVLSKEPQDPNKNIRTLGIQKGVVLKKGVLPLRNLRHDLRNEITPLKTIYHYIRSKSPSQDMKTQRYVELFGKSLEAMDLIIERTREFEMENGELWKN